jgi:hypothetical protein
VRRAALLVILAACGDNGGGAVDATPGDAFAPADALACAANAPEVLRTELDLPFGTVLDLDGVGPACDQAIAALPQLAAIDPVGRMLAAPHETQCFDFDSQVQVNLRAQLEVGGVPVVNGEWGGTFFVSIPTGEVFGGGSFLDAPEVPPPSCLGDLGLRLALPGHVVHYLELTNCFQSGSGEYTIAVGDAFTVGDEVLWIDPAPEFPFDATIHRARWVEVRLLPSHVDLSITFSDFMCCEGESLVDCVGTRVLADGFTAEVLAQERLCEPDCSP